MFSGFSGAMFILESLTSQFTSSAVMQSECRTNKQKEQSFPLNVIFTGFKEWSLMIILIKAYD